MRFQALDSWRGVAALLVVVYHGAFAGPLSVQGLGRGGFLWVDFFFVLSGFVVAHAYGERLTSARAAGGFLIRRFGRLWPLHVATLLGFVAAEALNAWLRAHAGATTAFAPSPNDNTLATFLDNLLLLNAMGLAHGQSWNGASWSIGAEFWTYIVFAAVLLAARGARLPAFAAIAATAAVALTLLTTHRPPMDATADLGFLRALYGFFVGALTQAAYRGWSARGFALSGRGAALAEIGVTALALALLVLFADGVLGLAAPLVFAPMVFVFAAEAGPLSRLLRAPPFVKLGAWSYSIYLAHPLIANAWARAAKLALAKLGLPPPTPIDGGPLMQPGGFGEALSLQAGEVALLLLVVAVASRSYAWLEQPARRAFNRWAEQWEQGGETAAALITRRLRLAH